METFQKGLFVLIFVVSLVSRPTMAEQFVPEVEKCN